MRIYSQDIKIEFRIEKFAMLVMKSGKRRMMEGIELTNQVVIRTLGEKKTYKYLGILVANAIKQAEVKEKIKTEYRKKTENYSRQKEGTLSKG